MSGFPKDLEFHHKNYYAFGSCQEVGDRKNLVGALTHVIVNIYEFEQRESQFPRFEPTQVNINATNGHIFMPNVHEKMFQVFHGRGKLICSDGSTTILDGINFAHDLVFVTRDEKIISVEGFQEWNLEYGLKCLVWDSNGSKTETNFSALFPQFFSKANLHVEKAFKSADEDELLEQDGWPFIFQTEGSPSINSNVFYNQPLGIDFAELEIKDVNDNPLGVLLNERDQIWRLKSEVGIHISSPPGLWKIQGLECQGFIRNLGTHFGDSSDHYNLEKEVRPILETAFLNGSGYHPAQGIGPLSHPDDRPTYTLTKLNQDD